MRRPSMALRSAAFLAIGAVLLAATPLRAQNTPGQDKLVVDIWGGNFRDGANEAIAKEFTKRTGMQVEFITGGTIDRLTKAKINRDHPESDVTVTTSHVGALYVTEGLFEKLDMAKLPNAKDLFPVAIRSPYHIGLYSYVYTPAFRTDLMPAGYDIKSWKDLWASEVKGKLGLPDFDPSHIIIAAALLAGANAENWKVGIPLLEQLKPSIKAFYQSDATSQDLMKSGETPVQVLLSINAFHQMQQGIPIKIAIPKEGAVVGIDAIGIVHGTKHLDAAYQYLNVALDPEVQAKLCGIYRCGAMNEKAKLDPELAKLPGVFTTPEQWKTQAIVVDDATRAKLLPVWKDWFTENMMQ
ncbi:MAG: extracellular solute-binding protein [Hyphomicrobiales bacterium]|nr:extracellular solute-binding protein [Hyphomicrobiales bacterium]